MPSSSNEIRDAVPDSGGASAPSHGGATSTTADGGPVGRVVDGLSTSRRAWVAFAVYATAVTALHVAGLHYRIYWEVWWWDLLTHFTSGVGVAALGGLLGVWADRPFAERVGAAVVILAVVGGGFEVYERLFRTFWHEWTFATYVEDTTVDIVVDALGGASYVALAAVAGWSR
jgi:hypothetical protein